MKAGAFDFITKPFNFDQINLILKKALENKRLQKLAMEGKHYKKLSTCGDLTELFNYRYFNEALEKEIRRKKRYNRPLSLIMIDIDNFSLPDKSKDKRGLINTADHAMYQDGGTLNRNLPEKTYLLLKKKLGENGLSVAGFDLFKPWFCAMAISIAELKKLGFDPAFGIDTYFFNKAKQDGKKRSFFETREFKLNLFSAMEELDQSLFLEQTLKDIKVIETMFPEIIKCWKNENSEELGNIINRSFKDYPAVYERFIINRNNKWLPEIEALIRQDKKVLIVVGVEHLVGKQGLIKMLKNKGCKIKQP